MDDQELLQGIAREDDLALRALFERHAPWLTARLRGALPPDAVEDALQETFIAVWRGAGAYRSQGEVGAWLWGIARRQAATWLRKHAKPEEELAFDTRSPDDPAAQAADSVDIERALATLGPPGSGQRELVRLALEEGRPTAEVASHLGVPEGTVKSRLHRVRRLLRTALRGGGEE